MHLSNLLSFWHRRPWYIKLKIDYFRIHCHDIDFPKTYEPIGGNLRWLTMQNHHCVRQNMASHKGRPLGRYLFIYMNDNQDAIGPGNLKLQPNLAHMYPELSRVSLFRYVLAGTFLKYIYACKSRNSRFLIRTLFGATDDTSFCITASRVYNFLNNIEVCLLSISEETKSLSIIYITWYLYTIIQTHEILLTGWRAPKSYKRLFTI